MRALIRHGYEVGLKGLMKDPMLRTYVEGAESHIDDPCLEGWPHFPEIMDVNRSMRPLRVAKRRLIEDLEKAIRTVDVGKELQLRVLQSLATRSGPPSMEEIEASVAAEAVAKAEAARAPEIATKMAETIRLRRLLLRSGRRGWGLWAWQDWSSWVLLLLLSGLCYSLARWLW
jgi:hypothetical protein